MQLIIMNALPGDSVDISSGEKPGARNLTESCGLKSEFCSSKPRIEMCRSLIVS